MARPAGERATRWLLWVTLCTFVGSTGFFWKAGIPAVLPLFGRVIVVDPGHGGIDGGAHDHQGLLEKELNLEIAHRLRKHLREKGAFVVMTREGDHELSYLSNNYRSRHKRDLNSRVLIAEKSRADLMLSLHVNSSSGSYVRGSMVFYQPENEESRRLAILIQEELSKLSSWHDNPPLAGRVYYILRNSPVTTVLIEVGFLTNPEEKELLVTESYQEKLAEAISSAVVKFFQE
ncbi:MAG: N-acetylmuramoyl-L-alanine amidase [Firmicutes bacterium]|nr:N-acetylmuramoyl-L-alanine amidase [Bacillota bacterium]